MISRDLIPQLATNPPPNANATKILYREMQGHSSSPAHLFGHKFNLRDCLIVYNTEMRTIIITMLIIIIIKKP